MRDGEIRAINAQAIVDSRWQALSPGMFDYTPDENRGSTFSVETVDDGGLVVLANMNTPVRIERAAFVAAVQVLLDSAATERMPIRVGSSNEADNSLDLCMGTKAVCNGVRVINYIVPLLLRMGVVGVGHQRPNTVWLHHA